MIGFDVALLDTNILVYSADETSPFHQKAKTLREKGLNGDVTLCICPQILSEYFAIITDSKRVSSPRTQDEAISEIQKYLYSKNILKIFPVPEIMEEMIELLKRYNITRQDIFDLQLVATMLSNNVNSIYTFNKADFVKFKEINVLSL